MPQVLIRMPSQLTSNKDVKYDNFPKTYLYMIDLN